MGALFADSTDRDKAQLAEIRALDRQMIDDRAYNCSCGHERAKHWRGGACEVCLCDGFDETARSRSIWLSIAASRAANRSENMTQQPELLSTEPWTREAFPTKEAWLKGRRQGIGASEASAVLGLNPWKSPLQLYGEKLELVEPDATESEAMEWGLRLEPLIADKYAAATGRKLADPEPFTLYRSRAYEFMTASFDRLITGDPRGLGVLQIKTTGAFKAEDWEDEPPVYYQVQVQQECAVLGATWGSLAVLIGGQRFRWFDLARNDRFVGLLVEREAAFWQRLITMDPPPVDGSDSAREILRRLYPKETAGLVVNLPADVIDWDAELQALKVGLKGSEARKQELENKIKAILGEAETGICTNGLQFTWKASERKGYVVEATTVRTLRRKEAK